MTEYQQFVQLIKGAHSHQTRNDGHVPYWVHCYRVSKLLEYVLGKTKEASPKEKRAIMLGALGHDLYEDTKVTREDIVQKYGIDVDSLIFQMTNIYGDNEVKKYCKKLKTISEAGLLIKLSDMVDNMVGGSFGIHENGAKWSKEFLFLIVHEQWLTVSKIKFTKYVKTAEYLKSIVEFGHHSLQTSIENYYSNF